MATFPRIFKQLISTYLAPATFNNFEHKFDFAVKLRQASKAKKSQIWA